MDETHPLIAFRKANNLTQEQFAERIGVTAAAVSRWEKGRRAPRGEALAKLCDVTGLSASAILGMAEAA